jgi:hypothetical protein
MGKDGSFIANQRDTVAVAAVDHSVKTMEHFQESSAWRHCGISRKLLWPPMVADLRFGTLFRKEDFIEFLLRKKREGNEAVNAHYPPHLHHLTRLKQCIDVVPHSAAARRKQLEDPAFQPRHESDVVGLFECPVTSLAAGNKAGFVCFVPCGHVVSLQAVPLLCKKPSAAASGTALPAGCVLENFVPASDGWSCGFADCPEHPKGYIRLCQSVAALPSSVAALPSSVAALPSSVAALPSSVDSGLPAKGGKRSREEAS